EQPPAAPAIARVRSRNEAYTPLDLERSSSNSMVVGTWTHVRGPEVELRPGCRRAAMKIYGADGKEMMTVNSIERDGSQLVIKGKLFGTMPLTAKLRPSEARQGLRLLSL